MGMGVYIIAEIKAGSSVVCVGGNAAALVAYLDVKPIRST